MLSMFESLPKEVRHGIVAQQNILAALNLGSKNMIAQIPMHRANMRILFAGHSQAQIATTIIPPIRVYMTRNGIVDDPKHEQQKLINHSTLVYRIAYNNNAIPLAHVYNESGYLCLGSIFVPSLIPYYSPLQPLETLFLANDRNMNHGHPQLTVTLPVVDQAHQIISTIQTSPRLLSNYASQNQLIPTQAKTALKRLDQQLYADCDNWCQHDTLWQLGHVLLTAYLNDDLAFEQANLLYQQIFQKEDKTNV